MQFKLPGSPGSSPKACFSSPPFSFVKGLREEAGVGWINKNAGTAQITLDEAIVLAKIRYKAGFGVVLL